MHICMQQSIFIQLQHWIFSFNDYIHSTSTRAIFVQDKYLFNFNAQSYVLCNEYIYPTTTNDIFIQPNIFMQLFRFSDIDKFLFNKAPPPYPPVAPFLKKKTRA